MDVDLQSFLVRLDQAGELHRVSASVSPLLELGEIAVRQCRMESPVASAHAGAFDPGHQQMGGKALLFESVEGSEFPVAINLFGSYRRMEMALGVDRAGGFESLAAKIGSLAKPVPPSSFRELLRMGREFLPLLRVPPRSVKKGICQEVVRLTERHEVDLLALPILKCWPLDGDPSAVGYPVTPAQAGTDQGEGRFITFAGIHTIHADDLGKEKPASHNIGMYRVQLIDRTRMVMHWHMHHDGAAHWRSFRERGEPMPVAICLGGEAVLPYAATAPLPPGISELLMAGFLNGKGIPLVKAKTVPLRVPANSEIVIEGFVRTDCDLPGYDPRVEGLDALGPGAVFEGPFGDHTGFYSLPDRYPLLEVTAMTHRHRPIFPATVVGAPPMEDYYLGKATERVFLPLLQVLVPDALDYHLPMFGSFHNFVFVRIKKEYPLQARRLMAALWGVGQMAWTKFILVVDDDVDVHDQDAVLTALFERCHFGRDLELVNGPLDILDHAAPRLGAGHKMGFDATRAWPGEEVNGVAADLQAARIDSSSDEIGRFREQLRDSARIRAVSVPEVGGGRLIVVGVDKDGPGGGARAIEAAFAAAEANRLPAGLVLAVDSSVPLEDLDQVLFHLCSHTDPGRDRHLAGARLGLDATFKLQGDERDGQPVRDFPPRMEMGEATRERVDRRWQEYGFDPMAEGDRA